MDALSRFLIPGIIFLLTVVVGFWVSHLGRPYHGLLFNIHKLLALGAVVAAIVQLARALKGIHPLVLVIALLVAAALCAIALFASGALLSMGKLDYALTLIIHRVAPVVLVLAMALLIYLVGKTA